MDCTIFNLPRLFSALFLYSGSDIESAMSPTIYEIVYYIAGWTLNIMRKVSKRKIVDFSPILMNVFNTCQISGELSKNINFQPVKLIMLIHLVDYHILLSSITNSCYAWKMFLHAP